MCITPTTMATGFETLIADIRLPTLIKFGAAWCGPCVFLDAALADVIPEYSGKIQFIDVDIDKDAGLAKAVGVLTVPTIIFLRDGKETSRVAGNLTRAKLTRLIEQHIEATQ